ncbi:MAG: cytochrome c [Anaerolineales bacterium]|nr:cytochrome c [Anaerolineales bacterium]
MMTDNSSPHDSGNLYIASILGILLMVVAAAVVWVAQVRPSVAVEAAPVEQPASAPAQPESAPAQTSTGDPAAGQAKFAQTCSACHGPTGEGIPNLGKNLVTSEFVAGQTDEQLLAFIKVGRPTSDPLNTTGIDMPPKGGNPALNDTDLENIVAYMRSIHK